LLYWITARTAANLRLTGYQYSPLGPRLPSQSQSATDCCLVHIQPQGCLCLQLRDDQTESTWMAVTGSAPRWTNALNTVIHLDTNWALSCYGSCTGCQSVSALSSRSRGSYISRLLERLPRTSQTTVAFCRTLVVAHCGPTPMTCGSCSCREHITNSVIGVSRPLSSTVERPSTWTTAAGTYLRLLQTISENSFIWRPKRLVSLLNV